MATYRYQAFDKNENKVKGFITADSKSDAINQLQLKELNPSTINEATKEKSNLNVALPIDCGQTISQPLVVAHMTQILDINKKMRVLEIGTGSGYQSLVLSKLSRFVYTIERHNILLKKAKNLLQSLEINNVFFKHADGGLGWSEQAPFDRIIVTASAPEIPTKLLSQLVDNGIMVIPVGEDNDNQVLKKIIKKGDSFIVKNIMNVRFVPLLEGKVEY